MGDRVYTSVTIHVKDEKNLLAVRNMDRQQFVEHIYADDIDLGSDNMLITYNNYECNYGNWDSLEDILQHEQIEYDKYWGAGGDFGAGNLYYRRINNEYQSCEIYETSESLLGFLRKAKDITDFKVLKDLINKELKQIEPFKINHIRYKERPKWGKGKDKIEM